MKVFEPLRTYSSPSRRAVDFIAPKASDPDPGSVMAQAPIFSIVKRGSAQRSFWTAVPRLMIAAEVSPIDTPMAVTSPGDQRQSSMMGIIWKAMALASPRPVSDSTGESPAEAASSRARARSKRSRAMASMPKVVKNLRRMS
jgi:hypothetical protein